MSESIATRKLPTKTKIIFVLLGIAAVIIFFLIENSNSMKANAILKNLNYNNITNLKVYSKTQVEDKDTRIQGFKYFVKYTNEKNQHCKGFILKDFKRITKQDIICE